MYNKQKAAAINQQLKLNDSKFRAQSKTKENLCKFLYVYVFVFVYVSINKTCLSDYEIN